MTSDMAALDRKPWWKGARGEWFVVIQVILIALVFFGPRTIFGQPAWRFPFPHMFFVVGCVLMVCGSILLVAGLVSLGRSLTPLPYPKEGAELIQNGAYKLVRHPIYSGGLILSIGWGLYIQGWLTLVYVFALFVFLDVKSRREERWLADKFSSTYLNYQQRVCKLIPFIY